MRRTGNSLWHVGWLLLLPEPGEEQRGWGYVLWLLVLGGFFTILGVAGLFRTPPKLDDAHRQWSLALLLLVQALLCSPSLYGRSRVMLGVVGGGALTVRAHGSHAQKPTAENPNLRLSRCSAKFTG